MDTTGGPFCTSNHISWGCLILSFFKGNQMGF